MKNKNNGAKSCKENIELSATISKYGLYVRLTNKIIQLLKINTSIPVLTIVPNDNYNENGNEKNRFNMVVFPRHVWTHDFEEPLVNLALDIRMVRWMKRVVLGHAIDVELTKRRVLKISEFYYTKFLNINKSSKQKITIILEIDKNQKILLKVK